MPAAATLSITQVFTPATAAQWKTQLLAIAAVLNIDTTSWQSGSVNRTLLSIFSAALSQSDAVESIMAQGGFLDFAATGVVTYTNPLTNASVTVPVTPDPSIPSQWPTPGVPPGAGWLDILVDSTLNVQRIQATAAAGNQLFANTTASTYGPFTAGTFHIANPKTNATYSNTGTLNITPSTLVGAITGASNATPIQITLPAHGLTSGAQVYITGVTGNTNANGFWTITVLSSSTFSLNGSSGSGAWISGGNVYTTQSVPVQADAVGANGTSATGTITSLVTSQLGVFTSNPTSFLGANAEGNVALAARAKLKQAALSPNGAAAAYAFVALSATQAPFNANLATPITRALVAPNTVTGTVVLTVANANGAVSGIVQNPITGATNASPIVITSANHGLVSGNQAIITGVVGNSAANGTWTITKIDANTFSLNGSTGNGTYVSGGSVDGGDLGAVDNTIAAFVVPQSVTEQTQSATNQTVNVTATVYVPAAQIATYTAAVGIALANYFAAIPIGGVLNVDGTTNVVPLGAVNGVLYAAGIQLGASSSYVKAVNGLLLNSVAADLAVLAGNVPVLGVQTITVVGV